MNRRSFIKSLTAVAAPYVITTAGVLMPVKKIITGINPHQINFSEGSPIPLECLVLLQSDEDGSLFIDHWARASPKTLSYSVLSRKLHIHHN